MLNSLKRMFCRHEWVWSERRRKEVCYRCRQSRRAMDGGPMPAQAMNSEEAARPLPNTGDEGGLPEVPPARPTLCVEPVALDKGACTAWDFGTLSSQSLNHAKVRDGRGT